VRLNESAGELARGNYSVSFQGKEYAEIAQLSDTLNYATRELEKTEDLRKELIANVSHDLRTPLTMIKAYSEVMRDLPGENTAENVQVIIDETERLTTLVEDMLNVSQLEAGTMTLKLSVYNLTDSVRVLLQRYNKLREQDGYTIDFSCREEVWVQADEDKMSQVLYNLINNAINYTGEDKKVLVKQSVKNGRVRMDIIDTGQGIAPADLPYIWDRYYRVDKSHKRAVQGTGLGLSIVKKVLELHHAVYGVESKPGMGADFWFEMSVEK
jgi:signal transduction histidine kinase